MPRNRCSLHMELAARVHIDADLSQDGVDDLGASADEEHRVFLVGRFQRLENPGAGRLGRCDLYESKGLHPVTFSVVAKGLERSLANGCEAGLASVHAAPSTGGEDVLVVDDGVEDQEHSTVLIGRELDGDALDHWIPLGAVVVCEGAAAARALCAAGTAAPGSIVLEAPHAA